MESNGPAWLPYLPIHEQQAFILGHESGKHKLSKSEEVEYQVEMKIVKKKYLDLAY